MSGKFVSAGTIDQPTERDDEWRRAQQEIEEERRRKAELGKQDGGKSLYDVLQQNKMAKQEAFEESIRLKNQFRALDEDEVEFLDSLLESTRAQEDAVKKETAEHLAEYQRQREEAERALVEGPSGGQKASGSATSPPGDEEDWVVGGRKRKRNKKDVLFPPKIRKSSSTVDNVTSSVGPKAKPTTSASDERNTKSSTLTTSSAFKPTTISPGKQETQGMGPSPIKTEASQNAAAGAILGLVAYDSDEDSE